MQRILILSTLLILVIKLNAQSWAPTGATWHYTFNEMLSYGYVKIVYTHDTTVLNKKCKILQKTQFGYSYPGIYDTVNLGKEFTYLDSNSNIVFRFFNNKFDTLYNFNALAGNKWTVHGMHGTADSGIVVVDSIGQKIINSDTLKSLFVSTISGSCIGWNSAKIVERIGCINGYMFPNYVACVMDAGEGGPLRCYADDNFPTYLTGESGSCDIITSIDSYTNFNDFIEVYPNPLINSFIIESSQKGIFEILNIQGKKIRQKQFSQGKTEIDISDLAKGIYILRINCDNKTEVTRIVKE